MSKVEYLRVFNHYDGIDAKSDLFSFEPLNKEYEIQIIVTQYLSNMIVI